MTELNGELITSHSNIKLYSLILHLVCCDWLILRCVIIAMTVVAVVAVGLLAMA
jgi:hypothetical protein